MYLTRALCASSDDSASAASSMEVTDRIASLEQRVQMQEDEIQLLKSALADVVRRLNVSEEQQAMGSRRGPTKGNMHVYCSCVFSRVSSSRIVEQHIHKAFGGLLLLFHFVLSPSL